jgi:hypothetical protein
MATGWGASTWSSNTWGGSQVALTGVSSQPTVGGVDPKPLPQIYEVHSDALVGTVKAAVTVGISGNSTNALVGTVKSAVTVGITGNSATGNVDTPIFTMLATGVSAVGDLGLLSVSIAYQQTTSGVLGRGAVQSVIGDRFVSITGCPAMGKIGDIGYSYWSVIDDTQTPNWTAITTGQTPNWTPVISF